MKKTLLIAGSMLSLLQAQAQQGFFKQVNNPHPNAALVKSILQKQAASAAAAQKPTAIRDRVIAQAMHSIEDGEQFTDSFKFAYTGTNGSKYDFNTVTYNESFEPVYAPMYNDHRYSSYPLNLLADSITAYEDGSLPALQHAFYRPDKKIDSVHTFNEVGGGNTTPDRMLMRYAPGGQLTSVVNLSSSDNGISFDTVSYSHYQYSNDFTKVLADTTVYNPGTSFANYYVNRYVYTAAGLLDTVVEKMISGGSEHASRSYFDYYGDGKLRKAVMQELIMSDWYTEAMDSLGYTPGLDYYTSWTQSSYDIDGNEMPAALTQYYPGPDGVPDSAFQYMWDESSMSWMPMEKIGYEYNSNNNPIRLTGTFYDEDGMPVPEGHVDFYYETYDDALSVKPIADNNDFRIYPNPFNNALSIDWKGKQQSKVTVSLINMIGQEIYKTTMTLNAGANTIQVPEINSGNYVLLLQDASGRSWSSKLLKK